ncbi:sigma-70 region 4 domain-containing protein [Geomonas limicola]|uniref:sigma-70 region 4 domain-containing protein n=1 Tax=Geomonas limicola TaxID=2740186 RepID=UPI001611EF59|nr:sigma-70 region 4 domain-containing protein [Geomonas limicola]
MQSEPNRYHSTDRKGFFAIWQQLGGKKSRQRSYRLNQLNVALEMVAGIQDTFISQNEFFRPNRRKESLARICVTFLDLDTYDTDYCGYNHYQMVGLLLAHCEDLHVPPPSVIMSSGRGYYMKWYYDEPVSSKALPRWIAVQKNLLKKFKPFGADPRPNEPSRVLRIEGSVNSKSGKPCEILWRGSDCYDFDTLCDEVLPFSRDEVAKRKVEASPKQSKKAPGPRFINKCQNPNLLVFSSEQLHWDRLHDLRALARMRGGVPVGQRDEYLFLAACFAAHCYDAHELPGELRYLAEEFAPGMSAAEVEGFMSSVVSRWEAAMKGQMVMFRGKLIDPRYTFGNAELVVRLGLTPAEMKEMKTIISAEEAATRHADRQRQRRAADGAISRAKYLAEAVDARSTALLMKEIGYSVEEISSATNRSVSSVQKYLAESARARKARPVPS